jgi:hypothetical protein
MHLQYQLREVDQSVAQQLSTSYKLDREKENLRMVRHQQH